MTRRDPLLAVMAQLTNRDRQLLELLHDHQVLTTEQITTALFPNLDTAQHRLVILHRLGVVDRFRWLREGGGSYSWRYTIAQIGADYIAALRGSERPRADRLSAQRRRLAVSPTLDHTLGVNQFFIDLLGHARTHPESTLLRWWSAEQSSNYYAFGQNVTARVIPDGHGIWTDGDHTVGWFLEMDTGTEALTRLVEKIDRYTTFIGGGGARFPVLFWLHSASRENHFHQRLAAIHYTVQIATAARDHGDNRDPAAAIWTVRGDSGQRRRLIDLPGRLTDDQVHQLHNGEVPDFDWR